MRWLLLRRVYCGGDGSVGKTRRRGRERIVMKMRSLSLSINNSIRSIKH